MQNLFIKYLTNQCSVEEVKELLEHFNVEENEGMLRELIKASLQTNHAVAEKEEGELNELLSQVYSDIRKQIETNAVVVPFYKNNWFRIAAAAAILLFISVAVLRYSDNKVVKPEMAVTQKVSSDIMPGGNKAILTLADGTTIILDSAANGNLTIQGNTKVIKLDGQLAYAASGNATEVMYNTVSTPRGGQYQLILSDGSKVWLNAESSIRFPATFIGKERNVQLTGEAYFEVVKNAAQPFLVEMNNGMTVEVLGTQFNVMAYDDEEMIKTTLVEGKVKIKKIGTGDIVLAPSQQAKLSKAANTLSVDKNPDVSKAVAWKNGLFDFDDDKLSDIMRQLSRWYDVDMDYSMSLSDPHFTGSIRREVNISQVLHMLELAGGVQFTIVGKKIVVKTK